MAVALSPLWSASSSSAQGRDLKRSTEWTAQERRDHMLGKWHGKADMKDRGVVEWVVDRFADGTAELEFKITMPDGTVRRHIELAAWGISGPIYFTLTRGWIQGDDFRPADTTQARFYDAYKIIRLDETEFEYEHFETGSRFIIKKVADDFQMPPD